MSLATVYQYREVDPVSGRVIISLYRMSAAAIEAIGAEVILDSEQQVREALLDHQGRYVPNG